MHKVPVLVFLVQISTRGGQVPPPLWQVPSETLLRSCALIARPLAIMPISARLHGCCLADLPSLLHLHFLFFSLSLSPPLTLLLLSQNMCNTGLKGSFRPSFLSRMTMLSA